MNFTSSSSEIGIQAHDPTVTATPFLTDIETELLSELKDLVYSIRGFREGHMGETGKVYTGSISAKRLDKASEVIKRAEAIRNGES